MMWVEYNENPNGKRIGDCAVRAVSVALGLSWLEAYDLLVHKGAEMGDMPSADAVWGAVLRSAGFVRRGISNYCPECYTVADFAGEHFKGVYVLGLGGHVVTIRDGNWIDSWDSGGEYPQFYYYKEE